MARTTDGRGSRVIINMALAMRTLADAKGHCLLSDLPTLGFSTWDISTYAEAARALASTVSDREQPSDRELTDLIGSARLYMANGAPDAAQIVAKWAGVRSGELHSLHNPFDQPPEKDLAMAFAEGIARGRNATTSSSTAITLAIPANASTFAARSVPPES